MALLSDVDWLVILAVAAFLLFGQAGRDFARQLGRLYGRALKFRDEMVGELTASAGLPVGSGVGSGARLRSMLLDDPPSAPTPPMTPPTTPYAGLVSQVAPVQVGSVETLTYGAAMGPGSWSVATTSNPGEVVRLR